MQGRRDPSGLATKSKGDPAEDEEGRINPLASMSSRYALSASCSPLVRE